MRPVCLPEKYEIIGELGHGGMGTVWHARDRILDRHVALKVLSEKLADDPQFVHRFTTEARAAASLNHPHIVQIYEFGETHGAHYLAMELIDGPSLKSELKRRGRFTEPQTIALARQACAALAVAHAAGIVHRDIKPDNMMFTRDGQFKLVDLGLAKKLDDATSHTMTGQSLGTPHFISPEQIMGSAEIDARADVYSLGATLYYLATGTVPFDGTSGPHIMSRHLNDPLPDPRLKAPDLTVSFCRVLGRMLAKSPTDRYQSISAVAIDLQRLQMGNDLGPVSPVASAVQETIFISSPDLNHGTTTVTWDEEDLRRITAVLAKYVGPLAQVLVRNARQRALSRAALIDELAGHVRAADQRDAFRAKCERLLRGGQTTSFAAPAEEFDPGATLPLTPTPGGSARVDAAIAAAGGSYFKLDEATRNRIVKELARHIGPVARVLVKREAARARDMADLTARLLANVNGDAARRSFQDAMQRLA